VSSSLATGRRTCTSLTGTLPATLCLVRNRSRCTGGRDRLPRVRTRMESHCGSGRAARKRSPPPETAPETESTRPAWCPGRTMSFTTTARTTPSATRRPHSSAGPLWRAGRALPSGTGFMPSRSSFPTARAAAPFPSPRRRTHPNGSGWTGSIRSRPLTFTESGSTTRKGSSGPSGPIRLPRGAVWRHTSQRGVSFGRRLSCRRRTRSMR
jgi:hypothetical protein